MLEKNGGIPYNIDMTTYPGAIDEFRNTANIQGVVFNPDDETTVFAEDTNAHSSAIVAIQETLGVNPQGSYSTVADRIAAGGGGGGAWELEFDVALETPASEIVCSSLDLSTDCIYEVYFGASCPDEITKLEFSGESFIAFGGQGWRNTGGSLDAINSIPWISHPAYGPSSGKMTISKMTNGSMAGDMSVAMGNQRAYHLMGADINYYSGGYNLEQIKLKSQTGYNMTVGSYLRIFKRVG